MTSRSSLRHYVRAVRHFAAVRGAEILALQASPILGCYLGGLRLERGSIIRFGLLLLGSLVLTAHVFVLNDWAGHNTDTRDPRRAQLVFGSHGISSRRMARVAIALLIIANAAFAGLGRPAILFGVAIAALSLLYSCSPILGKSTPIVASINHLLGGWLHFLLGYSVLRAVDANGLMIGLFFGLVFAAGHLNQEVRDYEGDLLNGICTSAAVFGCRRTFLASLCTFTTAYATLVALAALGVLPKYLVLGILAWLLHVGWSLQALQRGLGFETALWMQRRYRLLFAFVGLAMLVR